MITCPDQQLNHLIIDRLSLQAKLAPVLRRVGASHPSRTKVNAKRAEKRKQLKRDLRLNANAIAARCMEIFTP